MSYNLSYLILSGVNCKCHCPCCNGPRGVSRKQTIDKVIHIGHRAFLPEDHVLRYCGMSGECCPNGYYEGTSDSVETVNTLFANFKMGAPRAIRVPRVWGRKTDYIEETETSPAVESVLTACDGNCSVVEPSTVLFNTAYRWSDFKNYVQFAHCHFCHVRKYERHPDSYYERNGQRYQREFNNIVQDLTIEIGDRTITPLDRIKMADKAKKS